MMVPTQLMMDVYSKVLGCVRILEDMTVYVIVSPDDIFLICHMQDLEFLGMEFYLPVCLPLLQPIEVPLKLSSILTAFDFSV